MKIRFIENEQDCSEHEASEPEAQEIFKLADQLSEAELEKLSKIVANFRPETVKHSP